MVCVAQGPVMRRIVRSLDRAMPNSLARAETLRPRILKLHPAVDEVRLSGNIARLIRSQEDGKRRDLLGLAEPAHGLALNEASLHLAHRFAGRLRAIFDSTLERGRLDGPGTDRVCPDALADEVGGDGLGEADDRGLARAIDIAIGNAADRGDGGRNVDD